MPRCLKPQPESHEILWFSLLFLGPHLESMMQQGPCHTMHIHGHIELCGSLSDGYGTTCSGSTITPRVLIHRWLPIYASFAHPPWLVVSCGHSFLNHTLFEASLFSSSVNLTARRSLLPQAGPYSILVIHYHLLYISSASGFAPDLKDEVSGLSSHPRRVGCCP